MTEQDQEQKRGWVRQFWSDWWGLIVIGFIILAFILVPAVLVSTGKLRPGLTEIRATVQGNEFFRPEKYLWDWMDLILVPVVLAAGAALFTWLTDKRHQEAEERHAKAELDGQEKRAQTDRDIEQDRSRETALQTYLDRMTELIKDELRDSQPDDAKRSIARARTLTVLRQLDSGRKGLLLQFLHESELIGEVVEREGKPKQNIVDLSRADLSGANLHEAKLSGTDLSGANLSEADLFKANLYRADLCEAIMTTANLREANLQGADLGKAILTGANLRGANLSEASLQGTVVTRANLREADLTGADLRGANLRGAYLAEAQVTDEQLAQAASLEGSTLPDGTICTSEGDDA